jgi:hypothetical protein
MRIHAAYYPRFSRTFLLGFVLLLLLQGGWWFGTKDIRPSFEAVPVLPGREAIRALSFGDEEAYFRYMALTLQNLGDGYGQVMPLYRYNYALLKEWFLTLDALDARSHFVPSLASYYFSHTQYAPDIRYLVEYLDAHTATQAKEKWWWIAQAVYLANHKMKDPALALRLAERLANSGASDMPMWAKEMPAFIHEKRGELHEAYLIIKGLLEHEQNLSERDRSFMEHFIRERVGKIQAQQNR